jgi:hypothetical protein
MRNIIIIGQAAYNWVIHHPFYYLSLLSFCLLIYLCRYFTLFTFGQETGTLRELCIPSMTLWGLLVLIVMAHHLLNQELDNKTALLILTKPIGRAQFLMGKFLGITLSITLGLAILTIMIILTIWGFLSYRLLEGPLFKRVFLTEGISMAEYLYIYFFKPEVPIIIQGAFLSFLQIVLLTAIGVSLAAFFPTIIMVTLTTLVYILGNMASYMKAGITKLGIEPLTWVTYLIFYLLPNFAALNLQSTYAEGKSISLNYLLSCTLYGTMYIMVLFIIVNRLFKAKEI